MNTSRKIVQNFSSPQKKAEEKPKEKAQLKIVDDNFEKVEYEKFKKLLSEKLKDPKMAKKAALIISEMINKK